MDDSYHQERHIKELEDLLEQSERKADILTNLLKEANAELNQALEQVSSSEGLLRAIFESAPESIYIFDAETHKILDCNPFTLNWLGYTRQEFLSLKVADILEPKLRGIQENVQKAVSSGLVHIQEKRRFKKKSGISVDAEVAGNLVEMQGRKCFLALARDITERKTIEELSQYKELFDNVSDPVIICHSQGAFLEMNDVTCERFGYTRRQLLGMLFKDITYPDQIEILEEMGQRIRSGETVQFELNIRTQSGKGVPFEFHSRMINYQRKPAVLSVVRDLSVRKKMEKMLVRSERLTAVGELASGVAHNFNNLLQLITAAGEAALAKLNSGEIKKSEEAIKSIVDASQRGADIVKRIKNFTQFETDSIVNVRVFNLGDLIEEAVELTRPLWKNPATKKKYGLTYSKPPGVFVRGNPSEIYEVLVNIIKNGLEAMPRGGELSINLETSDGKIYTDISDTGHGIAEDDLQRIFQPFFTTKGSKSSGMGLSSSFGIIKKHQGEMIVRSNPGKGTTFTIVLPSATTMETQNEKEASVQKTVSKKRIKFLIIDDEVNILKMLEMWFEGTGLEVQTADSAEKGLQALKQERFDVILCDYGMDKMNGLDVGKAVKDYCRSSGFSKPLFMLYTGLDISFSRRELEDSGVDRLVNKPVPAKELLTIVHKLIAST